MKIGMNLLLWTGHVTAEHLSICQAIKNTGFDGVEIPIFDPSDPAHYRLMGVALDDMGLERTAVGLIPDEAHSIVSPDAAVRSAGLDHLKRVIECGEALGISALVGPFYQPLGVFTGDFPTEQELEHCAEVQRVIAPLAASAGIALALEPLNRFEAYLLNTIEQSVSFIDRVGHSNCGVLYDTFHANIEEKDPIAALHVLHQSGGLKHVHISENDRGTPGKGHAKIRETIEALKALNYDGWLTIEAFGRAVPELAAATRVWRDFFPNPEEVYTEGYRYIRECWG